MRVSKQSRRGVIGVLVLGLFIALIPRIVVLVNAQERALIVSHEEMQDFQRQVEETKKAEERKKKYPKKKKFSVPPSKFDPNLLTVNEWMNLGLSQKQADVVVRFAERGIKSNDELRRIFVISDEFFVVIKDSTVYPQRSDQNLLERKVEETLIVDLNRASKEDLDELPGIGEFYAKKIIDYRERLGGFSKVQQLLEIWKFDEEKLLKLKPFVILDESSIRKLNINEATIDELTDHPYISYQVANSIVKMRMHEPYTKIEDIRRSKLIDDDLYFKIAPYITAQ